MIIIRRAKSINVTESMIYHIAFNACRGQDSSEFVNKVIRHKGQDYLAKFDLQDHALYEARLTILDDSEQVIAVCSVDQFDT